MDLRHKQASLSEAWVARKQVEETAKATEESAKLAEESVKQGRTIMLFTVVTIILVSRVFPTLKALEYCVSRSRVGERNNGLSSKAGHHCVQLVSTALYAVAVRSGSDSVLEALQWGYGAALIAQTVTAIVLLLHFWHEYQRDQQQSGRACSYSPSNV